MARFPSPQSPAVREPVFLARQPIFDRGGRVRGYEMLFRDGIESTLLGESDRLTGFDWPALTRGRDAWINCTRDVLLSGWYGALPADRTVVELLEDVEPDPDVLDACRRLKEAGYRLALDDFSWRPQMGALVELADIVKVDVLASDDAEVVRLMERLRRAGRVLLAEKVETHQLWKRARDLGYDLFQGFFYRSPEGARALTADEQAWLDWLRDVQGDVPEVRRWGTLVAVARLARGKPRELLRTGLVRARMSEHLGDGDGRADARFVTGLLSVLDAALDRPLPDVVPALDLPAELGEALLGHRGPLGPPLEAVLAYENTDWPGVHQACERAGLPEAKAISAYRQALAWAETVLEGSEGA
jgi:EAL and modified HD-GYP domain-containing signal transduction protein